MLTFVPNMFLEISYYFLTIFLLFSYYFLTIFLLFSYYFFSLNFCRYANDVAVFGHKRGSGGVSIWDIKAQIGLFFYMFVLFVYTRMNLSFFSFSFPFLFLFLFLLLFPFFPSCLPSSPLSPSLPLS